MKIKVIKTDKQVIVTTQAKTIESYQKDVPLNFKVLLNYLVDLKFTETIELEHDQFDDIQDQAILGLIKEIADKYNHKVSAYSEFKTNHQSSHIE